MTKSREEYLADVDRVLEEVREAMGYTTEGAELDELIALQMLLKITKELHHIHQVNDLITKVLDSAIALVNADRAFLVMLENGAPRFKMGRDRAGNYLSRDEFSPSSGAMEEALETLKTVVVPDAQHDATLSKRASVQHLLLRTILCSPMTIKGKPIGLLYVDSQQKTLSQIHKGYINVMASLADQAAVAIVNAQKFETQA